MNLSRSDYALARLAAAVPAGLKDLGDMETRVLADRLSAVSVEAPVFITGLARSGTTILLDILARVEGVATHRYRDFPFVFTPYYWNRFQDRFAREEPPTERPHKDRIRITRESPEAFEEPIWSHFFPRAHDRRANHVITAEDHAPEFERFFLSHIKKILLIRRGDRYLSKGNYNLSRVEYLAKILPDALFIIPIRHPFTHVQSLVRQHRLFSDYARRDRRVPRYLKAAGHYEFGPRRVPITFTEDGRSRIARAWARRADHLGYAVSWREAYGYVRRLLDGGGGLARRIMVVRYEDLCADPAATVAGLQAFAKLQRPGAWDDRSPEDITAPPDREAGLSADARTLIWQETESVARTFGYEPAPSPQV